MYLEEIFFVNGYGVVFIFKRIDYIVIDDRDIGVVKV